jgi:hypothetical protein
MLNTRFIKKLKESDPGIRDPGRGAGCCGGKER